MLFLLDYILAQFPFGRERPAINDTKRFFLFLVGQGTFLDNCFLLKSSIALSLLGSAPQRASSMHGNLHKAGPRLSKRRLHRKVNRFEGDCVKGI